MAYSVLKFRRAWKRLSRRLQFTSSLVCKFPCSAYRTLWVIEWLVASFAIIFLFILLRKILVRAGSNHLEDHGLMEINSPLDAPKAFAQYLAEVDPCLRNDLLRWKDAEASGRAILHGPINNFTAAPTIGNGHLATIHGSFWYHVAGVYSGVGANSHLADFPSPLLVSVTREETSTGFHVLDFSSATFHSYTVIPGDTCTTIHKKFYAHRSRSGVMVSDVTVFLNGTTRSAPLTIQRLEPPGPLIDVKELPEHRKTVAVESKDGNVSVKVYETKEREDGKQGPGILVAAVTTDLPVQLTPTGGTARWLGVLAVRAGCWQGSIYGGSAYILSANALQEYRDAMTVDTTSGVDRLWKEHRKAWGELNGAAGWVQISGPDTWAGTIQRVALSSIYSLLSSLSPTAPFSIGPGGLAAGQACYKGHIFWDADMWVLPAVLPFAPPLAQAMLDYRHTRLDAARTKAFTHGYAGAMFPWESGLTGAEVCPMDVFSDGEIHVGGDISLAARQYFRATADSGWLASKGYPLVTAIADVFTSRAVQVQPGGWYEIRNVVPPDEYAWNVDNSVFTNQVAKEALLFAVAASELTEQTPPNFHQWKAVAENLFLPFDQVNQRHPEYAGQKETYRGQRVKQADVALLYFPLDHPMPPHVRRNDLESYARVMDPNGPAMTSTMYAIGYLGMGDILATERQINRSMQYVDTGGFYTWFETTRKNVNSCYPFVTGAGGLLQALVYGYGGLRYHPQFLRLQPLPLRPDTTLTLGPIHYGGWCLTITAMTRSVVVHIVRSRFGKESVELASCLYVCVGSAVECSHEKSEPSAAIGNVTMRTGAVYEIKESASLQLRAESSRAEWFVAHSGALLRSGLERYIAEQRVMNESDLTHGHTDRDTSLYPPKPAPHGVETARPMTEPQQSVFGRRRYFLWMAAIGVVVFHVALLFVMWDECRKGKSKIQRRPSDPPMQLPLSLFSKTKRKTSEPSLQPAGSWA